MVGDAETTRVEREKAQREALDRRLGNRPRKPIDWDEHSAPHLREDDPAVAQTTVRVPWWAIVWRLVLAVIVLQAVLFIPRTESEGPLTWWNGLVEAIRLVTAIWLVASARNIWERTDG